MRKADWKRIPEITEEEDIDKLEIGEYFLYGKNMVAQKQNKTVGQQISYYQVIEKPEPRRVVYAPVFDMLQEDLIKGD